ncbi:M28 family peptidase [Deinococcus planocerae]|uniref:M28 family peptidase n=1 Tax=Deinococcus planocerae TaxID=1737569 RepID=UPI000C7F2962|nr:M28 family peptidase [Deinococcus planocerae]
MRQLGVRAVLGALLLGSTALASIENDFSAVLKFGPRVTGTPANEQARTYLEGQFRALGYTTRREAFSYPRFDDLGSDVRVGERTLRGVALQGSAGGEVSAPVALVPGVGTPEEFRGADVRGKVAVVRRGQIPFAQKARNALAAGARGLIVVNNADGELRGGTLGERVELPVLGVSAATGAGLRAGQPVTLAVRVRQGDVRGVNVVAFKTGVTRPELLFGAHMDSVAGAPGANDNLSGTLAVLDLARRAVNTPLAARSYFVLFDGEEDGLRGSRAFVKDNAALVGGLRAMFNFDMVGVNVDPLGVSGDDALVNAAREANPALRSFSGGGGGSDHASFAQAGVATLFFHTGIDPNYHQPGDTVLDPALVRQTVDAALKTVDAVLSAAPASR